VTARRAAAPHRRRAAGTAVAGRKWRKESKRLRRLDAAIPAGQGIGNALALVLAAVVLVVPRTDGLITRIATISSLRAEPGGGAARRRGDDAARHRLLPGTASPAGRRQHAVTHDLTVSLIRPVPADARVDVIGSVLRRGRAVAFLRAEATVDGAVVAAAQVTLSVVALR
jgi:hypothetical protein